MKIKTLLTILVILALPVLAHGQGIDIDTILNFLFPPDVLAGLTNAWNAANDWLQNRFGIDLRAIVSWLGNALLFLLDFFVGIIKWIIELVRK